MDDATMSPPPPNVTYLVADDHQRRHMESVARLCGARYCPGVTAAENPNLVKPDPAKINTLSGIFLGCMAAACLLVAVGVDSLKR